MPKKMAVQVQVGLGTKPAQFKKDLQALADKASPVKIALQVKLDESSIKQAQKQIAALLAGTVETGSGGMDKAAASYARLDKTLEKAQNRIEAVKARTENLSMFGDVHAQAQGGERLIETAKRQRDSLEDYAKSVGKATGAVEKLNQAHRVASATGTNERQRQDNAIQKNQLFYEISGYAERNPNVAASSVLKGTLDELMDATRRYETSAKQIRADFTATRNEARELGLEALTAGQRLEKLFGDHLSTALVMGAINIARQGLEQMLQAVFEVDKALTELRKVSDITGGALARFTAEASKRAVTLGATLADTIQATADWKRLGYGLEDSARLADLSLLYLNVGDGIASVTEASESLISTIRGFSIEADNAAHVVDVFNEVGNNFAISSRGIGEALLRSASALAAAGNRMEQAVAVVTAANSVVQDPDKVGNALVTLSARLRGAKTEMEELGLDTDGMAESVSKLRGELLALTDNRLDIMLDADTFKSTYDILKDLAAIWHELADIDQANIVELIGGKRQANVLTALLNNFEIAERTLETALDAEGSALAENAKYLDSIAGKLAQLEASFQSLSTSVVDSGLIKGLLDLASALLGGLDALTKWAGALPTVTGLLTAFLSAASKKPTLLTPFEVNNDGLFLGGKNVKQTAADMLFSLGKGSPATFSASMNADIAAVHKFNDALKEGQSFYAAYLGSLQNASKLTQDFAKAQKAASLNTKTAAIDVKALSAAHTAAGAAKAAETVKTYLLQAAQIGLNMAMTMGISLLVSGLITAINDAIHAKERAIEKARELRDAYREVKSELEGNIATLRGIEDEFAELAKGVNSYGENVSLTNEQYGRYLELVKQVTAISPSLIKAYGKEGQELVNNNSLIEDAIELNERLLAQKREEYLLDGETLFAGYDAAISTAESSMKKLLNGNGIYEKSFAQLLGLDNFSHSDFAEFFGSLNAEIDWGADNSTHTFKLESWKQLLDAREELLARYDAVEDSRQLVEITQRLNQMEALRNQIEGEYKNRQLFLLDWAAFSRETENWYGELDPEYYEAFYQALYSIASNDSYTTLADMQQAVNGLGIGFVHLQDKLPTAELAELRESYSKGQISAEAFEQALEPHIAQVAQLMQDYPNLTELMEILLRYMRELPETVTVVPQQIAALDAYRDAVYEIKKAGSDAAQTANALGQRLEDLTRRFSEGEIAAEEYFTALRQDVEAGWFAGEGEEQLLLQTSLLTSMTQLMAEGFASLQSGFASGELSMEDYLQGLLAANEAQIALNDQFIASEQALYNDTDAVSARTEALERDNEMLRAASVTVEQFMHSNLMLAEILSSGMGFDTAADTAELYAQTIANDLWYIASTAGEMAQEIRAQFGNSYSEIYGTLMSGNANFGLAAQAMAANTNTGIKTMVQTAGESIMKLGEAIKDFKVELKFSAKRVGASEHNFEFFGIKTPFSAPEIDFSLEATGNNSLAQIGDALIGFGSSMAASSNDFLLELPDYSRGVNQSAKSLQGLAGAGKNAAGAQKALNDEIARQKEILKGQETAINDLLDMVIRMIKQEQKLAKESLQEQLADRKKLYEAAKKAQEKELDGYKAKIDAQRESLRLQEDERKHQDALADKQKAVSDINSKLIALRYDDSESAHRQRLVLEDELEQRRRELDELQHDRGVALTEDALDKEYNRYKELHDAKLDALHEEYEAYEAQLQDKIAAIDHYLSLEGQIRQDAMALIEQRSGELYMRLIDWNRLYGDGVDETVRGCWESAYAALMQFNGGQLEVYSTLRQIAAQMVELEQKAKAAAAAVNTANTGGTASGGSSKGKSTGTVKAPEYWVVDENTGSRAAGPFTSEAEAQRSIPKNPMRIYVVKKYAAGSRYIPHSQTAMVDERGGEMIVRGSGRYVELETGDGVLPHHITNTLMRLGSNPAAYIQERLLHSAQAGAPAAGSSQNVVFEGGNLIVQGSITEDILPQVEAMLKQRNGELVRQLQRGARVRH